MGRLPRIQVDGYPCHAVMRCNNKENLFTEDAHFQKLIDFIATFQGKHHFKVYAYAFLSNHCHLLIEPSDSASISVVMRDIMSNFAKWYNWRHKRKGHFWESRYHSSIVDRDEYALICMRYIHRNPVRAGIVEKPWDYPWTSVRHNAFGERNHLIHDLPSFLGISPYPKVRARQYRRWVEESFDMERHKWQFYKPFIGGIGFVERMRKIHLG